MILIFDKFDSVSDKTMEKLFTLLPPSRKQRALMKKGIERKIAILEYFLLKNMLKIDGNPDFLYSNNGKPYIEGYHFSFSHSGNVLVIATSSSEIGVDIEKIQLREKVATYSFNQNELYQLKNAKDKAEYFTTIYTKKEATIKLLDLNLANIKMLDYKGLSYKYKKYDSYIICVCEKAKEPKV